MSHPKNKIALPHCDYITIFSNPFLFYVMMLLINCPLHHFLRHWADIIILNVIIMSNLVLTTWGSPMLCDNWWTIIMAANLNWYKLAVLKCQLRLFRQLTHDSNFIWSKVTMQNVIIGKITWRPTWIYISIIRYWIVLPI